METADFLSYRRPSCGYDAEGYLLISRNWEKVIWMPDGSSESRIIADWDTSWRKDWLKDRKDIRAVKIELPKQAWHQCFLYRESKGSGLRIDVVPIFKGLSFMGKENNAKYGENNWLYIGLFLTGVLQMGG